MNWLQKLLGRPEDDGALRAIREAQEKNEAAHDQLLEEIRRVQKILQGDDDGVD
jgi:hypothetical protein